MSSKVMFIPKALVKSKAWFSLKGASQTVYLLFRLRCRMEMIKGGGKPGMRSEEWIITNNGEIEFKYDKAEKTYGIKPKRFCRAIDDLIAKGFIDIAKRGQPFRRIPTLYSISDRWRLFGTPDFEVKTRKKSKGSGYGFQKGNTLSPRKKKIPTVDSDSGLTVQSDSIATIRILQNGETEKYIYNYNGDKWLRTKIA